MDLKAKLPDPGQTVLLYGTTPPRLGTAPEAVAAAADKLAARLAGLPLDGLVVYDIQDETGRSSQPRLARPTGWAPVPSAAENSPSAPLSRRSPATSRMISAPIVVSPRA